MNGSGFVRTLMAKKMSAEKFLVHVLEMVELQLQIWDTYEVIVLKLSNYEIIVTCGEKEFKPVIITEKQIKELQRKGPYFLDIYIWEKLQENGVEIVDIEGGYFKTIGM